MITQIENKPVPIPCQCCGEVLMAKIYNGKLAIKTRKFGRGHETYLTLDEIKELFARKEAKKLDNHKIG